MYTFEIYLNNTNIIFLIRAYQVQYLGIVVYAYSSSIIKKVMCQLLFSFLFKGVIFPATIIYILRYSVCHYEDCTGGSGQCTYMY